MLRTMATGGDPGFSNCPSCGAPITTVESERCLYCGTAVNLQAKRAELVFVEQRDNPWTSWRKTRLAFGTALVMSCLGYLMTYCQFREFDKNLENSRSIESASKEEPDPRKLHLDALLGSVPGDSGKRFLLFSAQFKSERALCLLDPDTAVALWTSTAWRGPLSQDQIALSGDRVLVVDQSRLVSLDIRNGTPLWQASLTADFDPDNKRLVVSEERVALLTRDGTTQVFDVSSGKALWTRRQNPPPRGFLVSGNMLISRSDSSINVIDMGDGKVMRTLQPLCPTYSTGTNQRLTASAKYQLDGEDLYVFHGVFPCVDRWDLKTGTRTWQLDQKSDGPGPGVFDTGKGSLLLGDEHLFYSVDSAVYALRKSDGHLRRILFDAGANFATQLVQRNLLVIAVTPHLGTKDWANSENCSLWGFDINKREVLWRHNLPPGPQYNLRNIRDRVIGRFGPDELTLAQTGDDELILDRIDPDTGNSRFHKQLRFPGTHFDLNRPVYHGDHLWLTSKGFHGIDLKTGSVAYHFE
jgi:hypothetical protein